MCFASIDPEGIAGQPLKGDGVSMLYQTCLRVSNKQGPGGRDPWGEGVPELQLELLCDSANIKYSHTESHYKIPVWKSGIGHNNLFSLLAHVQQRIIEEVLV